METTHQQAITDYQHELEAWQQDKTQYGQEKGRMRNFIEHEIHHNTTAMERWQEENLQDIAQNAT
jgi:hypothetical protein